LERQDQQLLNSITGGHGREMLRMRTQMRRESSKGSATTATSGVSRPSSSESKGEQ
jgi:hypothetical protein